MPKGQSSKSTKVVRSTVAAKLSHSTSVAVRPSEAEIAVRAYEIYLNEGRPDGRDLIHWAQAETELGVR